MHYLVPTPIIFVLYPFLAAGMLLNAFVIWLFTSNKKTGFGKSFTAALISYLFLAVFGLCITFYHNISANFIWFMIYWLIAIAIQWLVTVPYFNEFQFSKFKLLFTSFVSNTFVFGILTYMLFYGTGVVVKYLDWVKILLQDQGINF